MLPITAKRCPVSIAARRIRRRQIGLEPKSNGIVVGNPFRTIVLSTIRFRRETGRIKAAQCSQTETPGAVA